MPFSTNKYGKGLIGHFCVIGVVSCDYGGQWQKVIVQENGLLKVALVGCGRIAKRHAEILSSGAVQTMCLVAVCDVKSDRVSHFQNAYAAEGFSDMHEMMSSIEVDIVVVTTPSGLHAEHVLALSIYKKHIVVEKPMALTVSDADKMIEACASAGVNLFVVKQNRFNVPVLKLKDTFVSGRFGKVVCGSVRVRWCRTQDYYDLDEWRGTWAQDGGVIANQAIHHIDLLMWLLGEVNSVYALTSTALVDIEVEDTAVICLRFASGALGVLELTTAARPTDLEGSLSILGENGVVEIGGFAVNQIKTWNFNSEKEHDEKLLEQYSTNPPDVYGFGHSAFYQHVSDALYGIPQREIIDGIEGRKSLELISAIYQSAETGMPVEPGNGFSNIRLGCRDVVR